MKLPNISNVNHELKIPAKYILYFIYILIWFRLRIDLTKRKPVKKEKDKTRWTVVCVSVMLMCMMIGLVGTMLSITTEYQVNGLIEETLDRKLYCHPKFYIHVFSFVGFKKWWNFSWIMIGWYKLEKSKLIGLDIMNLCGNKLSAITILKIELIIFCSNLEKKIVS